MQRFETNYPLNAREEEIKQILHFVTRGQSCQLISIPGAGRSTVLRLLAYHKKLSKYHLSNVILNGVKNPVQHPENEGDPHVVPLRGTHQDDIRSKSFLFAYLNFAEITSFEMSQLTKSLFLAILASIREVDTDKQLQTIGKEIYLLFKEALSLGDSLVMTQRLKRAIELLTKKGVSPVFLFDRFSEFAEKTTSDLFTNLKALRIASGGKLAIVFSTHRPLEDLLPVERWREFYEFFLGNHVYLTLYDKIATDFRISVIEQEYGKTLDSTLKKELVLLTGGHGKLMKLSTQILLNEPLTQKNPSNYLLSHILIKGSLLEIWQALTRDEQETLRKRAHGVGMAARIVKRHRRTSNQNDLLAKLHLPFPLFTEFVRRNIAQTLVPKTIRLDEGANEIYFGDEQLEGLTAQEFRLLKFLIQTPNQICNRNKIIETVWSDTKTAAGVTDEALDQMVHRVRKKSRMRLITQSTYLQ